MVDGEATSDGIANVLRVFNMGMCILMKRYVLAACLLCSASVISAQAYHGTTGLLQVPSAETDSAGTFRGGVAFLDKRFMPNMGNYGDGIPFNTMGYTIGLTAWHWLELSYTGILVKMHPDRDKSKPLGYYNEDRHINIKLRPLKEGKWWPAMAIGMDDVGRFSSLKTGEGSNSFFQNIYIAATKHFDIKGYELGAHLAYRYYSLNINKERRGLAGGLTFVPRLGESLQGPRAWLQRPRFIVEWDGIGVNVGADVLLWRHLFIQAALIHGQGFTGGLAYHYTIPF